MPVEVDVALGVIRYRNPVVGPAGSGDRDIRIGETADTLRRCARRSERGAAVLVYHERDGLAGDTTRRRCAVHPRGSETAGGGDEDVPLPGRGRSSAGAASGRAAGDAEPARIDRARGRGQALAARHRAGSSRRHGRAGLARRRVRTRRSEFLLYTAATSGCRCAGGGAKPRRSPTSPPTWTPRGDEERPDRAAG